MKTAAINRKCENVWCIFKKNITVFVVTENEDSNPSEESSKSKSTQEDKNLQGQRQKGIQISNNFYFFSHRKSYFLNDKFNEYTCLNI